MACLSSSNPAPVEALTETIGEASRNDPRVNCSISVQAVRTEIEQFTRGSFLEASPIVSVSASTGAGFDELKQAIVQIGAEIQVRDSIAMTRLPIDRVFTIKG